MKNLIRLLLFLIVFAKGYGVSKAQVWNSVSTGANVQVGGSVDALLNFEDTLYAAGYFDSIGGIYASGFARWNGVSFENIGNITSANVARGFGIHNNELYMGGGFYEINNNSSLRKVVKFNGVDWDSVGGGALQSSVYCFESFQGNLYAGGLFTGTSNPNLKRIAYWDGLYWNALGTGMNGSVTQVFCMAVYNGDLYIGGEFNTANGIPANYIAKWDGSSFSAVGGGTDATVFAMIVDSVNGRLICGGNFYHAGGVTTPYNVAAWDGTNWNSLGTGTPGMHDLGVRDFAFYRNKLFATGANEGVNNSSDSLHFIAMWDGNDWQPLGNGTNSTCLTLEVFNDELYVGGNFDYAGDSVAHKIARWYMPPLGIEEASNQNNINISLTPNPAHNILHIQTKNFNATVISLYDITGKKVLKKSFHESATVNVSSLSHGMYFYEVQNNKGETRKGKVVVQ